ncbi:alpha/beta fold hydrolase [Legionella oakridgensis]|uniref:Hydrolases or acyltransferases (Alpha/beta hydrolase superfamily) n=2 Tax=Legionella oakridgensis TaxID=29423 RepID=A0A0W0X045_9GAMM|nr:alpha/beta hydrolase [Legionella oakridgensis]AHE67274.1 putative hydrolases or acyltransferase [Legionella oakridgensis ATCC 33761 = DSM 21215]ETO93104.1 putative hydrolase or acyltransferase [Legionella oakridgensis RV-2-2007]KTD37937.1 hydrolases or acyltransferases (alpha/beta hydrolase superfamily) [Legionella oakridgensis]STY20342.1 hydrolases or acyltransferases (alpha/beta hydrolase superfamily) [Legionella longbeachae]
MRELLHFAHGNGFPSPCYRQMFHYLQPCFDYCYIDRVGHTPEFPVTENWHYLVDEVTASIKRQASKPVIALGHSLGGVLSFRAAVAEPSLFKAVILLDSPIIGRFKSNLLRLSKTLGMIDHVTPAFRTRGRRQYWQTKEQAWSYLRSRTLFKDFTDACLEDYIDYGMQQDEQGYSLRFDRQVEYQIYRTIPHMLYEYEGKLKIPAVLIYGSKSNIIDRMDLRYMQKHYNIKTYEIRGSHMFPMEHPEQTANLVIKAVDALFR